MWQAAFFKKWYKSLSPEMGQDEIVPSDVKKKKKKMAAWFLWSLCPKSQRMKLRDTVKNNWLLDYKIVTVIKVDRRWQKSSCL